MTPMDPTHPKRLSATLEDVERAIEVAQVHIECGCPQAAAAELRSARAAIAHARRLAHGPARDSVSDDDTERLHAEIAAGRSHHWMTDEERDLYDY